MENPLALHPVEVVVVVSWVLTLALWVLLVRGLTRHGWPLGPTLVLAVVALLPVIGPVAAAATVLYVTTRRRSAGRAVA
jgi:hypothetical protein